MNYIKFVFLCILSISFIHVAFADLSPPPPGWPLTSDEGKALFEDSKNEYKEVFWRISQNFEAQEKTNSCGIASVVVAMNTLGIDDPNHKARWTQEGFFTEPVQQVVPLNIIDQRGMNLRELKAALETFHVRSAIYYWNQYSEDEMRRIIEDALLDPDKVVIANYFRPALGLPGEGHYSPIAMYNNAADSVLMMDVAEYCPPPAWVKVDDLLLSMQPVRGKVRGFLVISKDHSTRVGEGIIPLLEMGASSLPHCFL